MHMSIVPLDTFVLTVMETNYILLCLSLLYIPSNAYRRKTTNLLAHLDETSRTRKSRKTTKVLQLTKPVRTTKKPKKSKSEEHDGEEEEEEDADTYEDEDVDEDTDKDEDTDGNMDRSPNFDEIENPNKEDTAWFDELKADSRFGDEDDDDNMFRTTDAPLDLRSRSRRRSGKWTPSTMSTTETTTEPTTTIKMDLKVIGFNDTWCDYVNKTDTGKKEGQAFVDAVKKLCSKNHTEDNDVRLALRHSLENRKLIDRLMDDVVNRMAGNDTEKREKIVNPKYKVSSINQFCYDRVLKSFKYLCFDPEMNPYMQRYLNIVSNACRITGLDEEIIRDHLVDACEDINNNMVDVF